MDEPGNSGAVRVETDADRIATIWIDSPGAAVNTLSTATWDGLDAAVRQIEANIPVGVVIASTKPRSFLAGADLFELDAMIDTALESHLARGQSILDRLAALPMPTVASIHGDALGGGLEVALACQYRIVVDEPRIKLGLPETTLGLVPGWGGTFRLPRLVGIERALSLLVSGKALSPQEAAEIGLVDQVVHRDEFLSAARQCLRTEPAPREPAVDGRVQDCDVCDRFRHSTRERSGDHLPAPLRVIDIVETGLSHGHDAAMKAERAGLVELRRSPAGKQLLRMFFLRTAAKKKAVAEAGGRSQVVQSAVVIGGGTMGAGIATACATAGLHVQVIEVDESSAQAARSRLGSMSGGARVKVTADWKQVASADFVVEAATENLAAKQAIFRELDKLARPDAILATNTSSLGVAPLAAVTKHPARVIGLHFFNPVARMPLVEVARGADSSPDAVATGVAVATMLGKTPVVCRDAPGFIINRVLFPYLRAALELVDEGADITALDAAVRHWGMPTGPCVLLDEIGLDVSLSIFQSLRSALGERFPATAALESAVERGWFGKKSGRGLYVHGADGRPAVNTAWPRLGTPLANFVIDEAVVERRLIQPMAKEAELVLADGVVETADAIDLASVLGMGFPAFRGGLATHASVLTKPASSSKRGR
jgi:3-hydroxyacyl-CoA dehydrogenase/enoyl-CoA hydratase/3-hydroxybutyryl-CoA epimerase